MTAMPTAKRSKSARPASTKQAAVALPAPGESESLAIVAARARLANCPLRLAVIVDTDVKTPRVGPNHDDLGGWVARLQDAFGVRGTNFPSGQIAILSALAKSSSGNYDVIKLNTLIASI